MTVLVGAHALWLIPVASQVFAEACERWWWQPPDGIPNGDGTSSIGYYPTNVVWVTGFVLPLVLLVLGVRAIARASSGRRARAPV